MSSWTSNLTSLCLNFLICKSKYNSAYSRRLLFGEKEQVYKSSRKPPQYVVNPQHVPAIITSHKMPELEKHSENVQCVGCQTVFLKALKDVKKCLRPHCRMGGERLDNLKSLIKHSRLGCVYTVLIISCVTLDKLRNISVPWFL